jgi:hypothetical protein
MEAMQAQSVDVIKRMKEITLVMQTPEQVLEAQGVSPGDIEGSIPKSLVLQTLFIYFIYLFVSIQVFILFYDFVYW